MFTYTMNICANLFYLNPSIKYADIASLK